MPLYPTQRLAQSKMGTLFNCCYLSDEDDFLESSKEPEGKIYLSDEDGCLADCENLEENSLKFEIKRKFIREKDLWEFFKDSEGNDSFLSAVYFGGMFICISFFAGGVLFLKC